MTRPSTAGWPGRPRSSPAPPRGWGGRSRWPTPARGPTWSWWPAGPSPWSGSGTRPRQWGPGRWWCRPTSATRPTSSGSRRPPSPPSNGSTCWSTTPRSSARRRCRTWSTPTRTRCAGCWRSTCWDRSCSPGHCSGPCWRPGGSVINVSSDAGVVGYPGWGAYGVSKAALDQMTRIWASELDGTGCGSTPSTRATWPRPCTRPPCPTTTRPPWPGPRTAPRCSSAWPRRPPGPRGSPDPSGPGGSGERLEAAGFASAAPAKA